MKVTKASITVPDSPYTSTPSSSNSTNSSVQASEGDFDSLRLDPSDPGTCPSEPELELIILRVINKSEAEGDMSTDLRVGFKERHRKRLHEAIDMVPPPTKKACPEKAREKPGREVPPMPMPPRGLATHLLLRKRSTRLQVGPLVVLLQLSWFWTK